MKYLLAYDGSSNSKQALDLTIKLLKPTDDQLVVLTVTERIPQADWPFFGDGALPFLRSTQWVRSVQALL
jgi:nucleotide-binding universal stress UspA family protein